MHDASTPLVVIGASVRAFAASASRAGRRVHAADLFDDLDLRETAAATAWVRDFGGYPAGLVAAARTFPPAAFCYLGALENHPEIIGTIARERPLLGSRPEAVAAVRDLWSLRRLVHDAGLESPECHADPRGLPRDGSFLRKPAASAGGRGIVPWDADAGPTAEACVWQRRVAGETWAAAYVVSATGARLLGASRQLTGLAWCHARPFAYCGSIDVPLGALPAALRRQCAALAPLLVACGLRGVVGIDLVVDAGGRAWVVEVNPRPTASMELIERATGTSIAAAHIAACGGRAASPTPPLQPPAVRWAKAVLFAPWPLTIAADLRHCASAGRHRPLHACGGTTIGDVPPPGRTIPAGGPVCTLFAAAPTAHAALASLRERAADLTAMLSQPAVAERLPAATPGRIP